MILTTLYINLVYLFIIAFGLKYDSDFMSEKYIMACTYIAII